jgi:hypothetical protein
MAAFAGTGKEGHSEKKKVWYADIRCNAAPWQSSSSRGITECFKKRFRTLKAYINVFRGHVQCFEMS